MITNKTIYVINIFYCNYDMADGMGNWAGCWIYINPTSKKSMRLVTKKIIYHELYHNFNPGFGTLNSNNNDLMWFREMIL